MKTGSHWTGRAGLNELGMPVGQGTLFFPNTSHIDTINGTWESRSWCQGGTGVTGTLTLKNGDTFTGTKPFKRFSLFGPGVATYTGGDFTRINSTWSKFLDSFVLAIEGSADVDYRNGDKYEGEVEHTLYSQKPDDFYYHGYGKKTYAAGPIASYVRTLEIWKNGQQWMVFQKCSCQLEISRWLLLCRRHVKRFV